MAQKIFTGKIAATMVSLLFIEQVIDVVGTQIWLTTGASHAEGNSLVAAQFNQSHSVFHLITIFKLGLPLLLFPMTYFVFKYVNDGTKLGKAISVFFVLMVLAITSCYVVVLAWNFHFYFVGGN